MSTANMARFGGSGTSLDLFQTPLAQRLFDSENPGIVVGVGVGLFDPEEDAETEAPGAFTIEIASAVKPETALRIEPRTAEVKSNTNANSNGGRRTVAALQPQKGSGRAVEVTSQFPAASAVTPESASTIKAGPSTKTAAASTLRSNSSTRSGFNSNQFHNDKAATPPKVPPAAGIPLHVRDAETIQKGANAPEAKEMTSLQLRAGSQPVWKSASRLVKRLIDLTSGLLGLVLLAPFMVLIAVAIKLESRGPAMVRELRIGYKGNEFSARRFRTCRIAQESIYPNEFNNEPWQSRVGTFLAGSGLDLLPLLFSIVRGHMSLVGPRPLTIPESRVIAREDPIALTIRNTVAPGLTGAWQVGGRLGENLPMMINVDLDYINRWSLLNDLTLLLQTFSLFLWK